MMQKRASGLRVALKFNEVMLEECPGLWTVDGVGGMKSRMRWEKGKVESGW